MSTSCISCHKSTKIDNGSFLLECIQCNVFWHHRCHRPPVPDKDLAQVLTQFTQDRKRGVKNAKVQWTCINCVKSKGKARESQISTEKKQVIVIDDDDEIEIVAPPLTTKVGDGDRPIPPTKAIISDQQSSSSTTSMSRSLKAQSTKTTRSHATNVASTSTSHAQIDSLENEKALDSRTGLKTMPGVATKPLASTKSVVTKSITTKSVAPPRANLISPPPAESSKRQNPTTTKSTKAVKSTTRPTESNLPSSSSNVISHNVRTGISIIDDPLVFASAATVASNPSSGSSSASSSNVRVPAATVTQKQNPNHAPTRSTTLASSRCQSIVAGLDDLSMSTPEADSYPPSSHRPSPADDPITGGLKVKQEQLEAMQIDQLEPPEEVAHSGDTSGAAFVPTPGKELLLLQDWVEARHRVRTANEGPDLYDRVKQRRSAANKRPRKARARSLATIQASSPTFITSRANAPLFEFSARVWKNEKIRTIESLKF